MKWYQNLTDKEKNLIKYGSILIVIAVLWSLIYMPMNKSIDSKTNLKGQLITQIQEMEEVIKKLKKSQNSAPKILRKANQPFISWIDEQLVNKNLAQYMVRSEPKDNQTLILLFENIVFDDFIAWLEPLVNQYNIIVSEADVNSIDRDNGLSNIRLTLIENL